MLGGAGAVTRPSLCLCIGCRLRETHLRGGVLAPGDNIHTGSCCCIFCVWHSCGTCSSIQSCNHLFTHSCNQSPIRCAAIHPASIHQMTRLSELPCTRSGVGGAPCREAGIEANMREGPWGPSSGVTVGGFLKGVVPGLSLKLKKAEWWLKERSSRQRTAWQRLRGLAQPLLVVGEGVKRGR